MIVPKDCEEAVRTAAKHSKMTVSEYLEWALDFAEGADMAAYKHNILYAGKFLRF